MKNDSCPNRAEDRTRRNTIPFFAGLIEQGRDEAKPVNLAFIRYLCLRQVGEGGEEIGCVHQIIARPTAFDHPRPIGDERNTDPGLPWCRFATLDLLAIEDGTALRCVPLSE